MSEVPRPRQIENPRQRFSTQVRNAMRILHAELDRSNFVQVVQERYLAIAQTGKEITGPIFFDEVIEGNTLESYEYSAEFRPKEGIDPIDALSLKRRDISLFLQLARSTRKKKTASIAELTIRDETYYGGEALARIHEAFPRFYPTSQVLVKAA